MWLVVNQHSGSHDPALVSTIAARCADAGQPIDHIVDVGEDALPDARLADTVARILILTGDGTISSLYATLKGWAGELLVLPGGTMNLLARALHGESEPLAIVDAMLTGHMQAVPIPLVIGPGLVALSGIFAGPTTAWGDVREQVRNIDLSGLAEAVPRAITATLGNESVQAKGIAGSYPSFYLQPGVEGFKLTGIRADGATDLLAHGWAWLTGDFRNGPSDMLAVRKRVTISNSSSAKRLSLLVDGEKAEVESPATFRAAISSIRFLSLTGACTWP